MANVGDSRCVGEWQVVFIVLNPFTGGICVVCLFTFACFLWTVSEKGLAVEMSYDHKPEDPVETARINKAGGKVTSDGRVNNGLNLSRALGTPSHPERPTQNMSSHESVGKLCLTASFSPAALGDHNYKRNEALDLSGEQIWRVLAGLCVRPDNAASPFFISFFPLSEQMISAKPDIKKLQLDQRHEFMVIACDGIW